MHLSEEELVLIFTCGSGGFGSCGGDESTVLGLGPRQRWRSSSLDMYILVHGELYWALELVVQLRLILRRLAQKPNEGMPHAADGF